MANNIDWEAPIRLAWLREHPRKTVVDWNRIAATKRGRKAFARWSNKWLRRQSRRLRRPSIIKEEYRD
jgi:hypothetical protein